MNKKYGIFKVENGYLLGYIENSFSMDWSKERVRLWNAKDIKYYQERFAKQIANKKMFVVRITNTYPQVFMTKYNKLVKIHWKERQENINSPQYTTKFDWRNVKFSIVNPK